MVTDHFAEAERLLARVDADEIAPPLIPGLVRRAGIHAQLAIAQAIAHSANCGGECAGDYFSSEYARIPLTGEYKPVQDAEVTGDRL